MFLRKTDRWGYQAVVTRGTRGTPNFVERTRYFPLSEFADLDELTVAAQEWGKAVEAGLAPSTTKLNLDMRPQQNKRLPYPAGVSRNTRVRNGIVYEGFCTVWHDGKATRETTFSAGRTDRATPADYEQALRAATWMRAEYVRARAAGEKFDPHPWHHGMWRHKHWPHHPALDQVTDKDQTQG